VDLGTGDGAAVLRLARREQESLVIGVDTDASAMREASRRAASRPARGGLSNAVFLAGTLKDLAALLPDTADQVRVTLPWGSLLRESVAPDPRFVAYLRTVLRPGGAFQLIVSLLERDLEAGQRPFDTGAMDELAAAYAALGFVDAHARPVTIDDVRSVDSSWAKRLGIPARRPAWLLAARSSEQRPRTPAQSCPVSPSSAAP
jgi:16S rRNA (adenine(1408)-N(1))-methyltransferase